MWQKDIPYKKYHVTRMMLTKDLKNKTFLRETGTKFLKAMTLYTKKEQIRAVQTFFHWVYQSSYSRQKIYSKQRKAHDWKLISEQHDTKDLFSLYKSLNVFSKRSCHLTNNTKQNTWSIKKNSNGL